jgi:ABC-type amino acid transport substrate-binding protein
VRYLALTALLTVGTLGGLRLLFGVAFEQGYTMDEVLAGMQRVRGGVEAVVHQEPVPPLVEPREISLLARIRARGVLRVGYTPDNPPYSFLNGRGELVGFDVEMAHELARTLETTLEFLPVEFAEVRERMSEGCCDLMMSGVVITPERAEEVVFSVSYLEEHLAFLTSDHLRSVFADRHAIRARSSLRIGALPVSYIVGGVREYAPEAEIDVADDGDDVRRFIQGERADLDAFVLPAERGAIYSIRYPRLSVVVPDPPIMTIPLAYVVGENDERLRLFLNTWIDVMKRDGTIDDLRDYWVYGKDAQPRKPRWSIIRNVLGWLE